MEVPINFNKSNKIIILSYFSKQYQQMAYLLKPKAKSLVVSTPFANELKNHIAMVEEREFQTIKEKLQRQQQKEQRLNAIQKQFVEWADKKQNKIKQKIQKSTKLKEDHLNKIVKKCQQHQKYLGQKLRQFKTKNKTNLKDAWKKVEALNKHHQNKESQYTTSKQVSPNRSSAKLKTHNDAAESRFIENGNNKDLERQYLVVSYNNASKHGGNSSKEYFKELNQSLKHFKNQNTNTIQIQEVSQERETQVSSKLKETFARFKNFIEQSQQQKIQQLGKRLMKIQQSRIRKHELNSKKKHHNRTLIDNEADRKRQQKPKNKTERLHSESFVRQKRVNDWSQITKQKREEMFQTHLQNGTEYLQEQKLKYMKTSLSKKVALSAVQKKLYFQRLNH